MENDIGKCPALAGCGMFDDEDLTGWLTQFPDARDLDLSGSQVTSGCLATLAQFSDLQELDLSHTAIDDSAVPTLMTMNWLVRLDLKGTRIGPDGIARLRQALEPDCAVTA